MPKHSQAIELLYELSEGDIPWGIPVFCIGEFLRVVTHQRVFNPPTRLEDALEGVDSLLTSHSVRLLHPGERFWRLFQQTSLQSKVSGNLVFDAQIAALCLEHGIDTL